MRPMVDLEAELNEIAGHLNAQHARLTAVACELLEQPDAWAGEGIFSIERYLCWQTGISPSHARQVADIVRRARELPECVEAFRRGELSLDQATVLARKAPAWADSEVTDLAKMLTVDQLRRSVGKYPFPVIPTDDSTGEPSLPDEADDGRLIGPPVPENHLVPESGVGSGSCCVQDAQDRCWFGFDDDGRFRLHLDTDQLAGLIIERALEEARDTLFQHGQPDVTWADAVLEIANRSLDAVTSPTRRNRFRINLHLTTDGHTTGGHATDGHATDGAGYSLPDAIRRYITCDGMISPVLVEQGVPVSVGRSQHIVPDRTRRVVEHRDGGCTVPGCTNRHFLEVHHIIHWDHGGTTDTWNLICLCGHHHRLHHQGKLGITGNADQPGGITFTDGAGKPIRLSGAKPTLPGAPPPPPIGRYEHPLGERLEPGAVYFNPPAHYRQQLAARIRAMSPNYDTPND